MGGSYQPRPYTDPETQEVTGTQTLHVGWTIDSAKADAARELGATVTPVGSRDPAFTGWEVSVNEVEQDV
jgi:hypothetical protein